ncbi:MAG: IclR family transcriptional regulator [Propionibacterium sp.]|nr:IclR family transcriptional regulator [Propionibacterium sp.]
MDQPRGKVPAADATLAILTLLARHTRPVAAARIAAGLGLPRSTTYDLLGTLVARGFVIHYEYERAYGLGVAAYELSSAYTRQAPLAILGRRAADRLVEQLGESVHVAVLHARDVLYVVEARAPGRPSLVTDVGVRLPAHLTATGRALLAALPDAQLRALYDGVRELEVRPGFDSTLGYSVARVLAEAKETRARGHAIEEGEVTPGLSSVAVAVLDRAGWPIASIAITYPSEGSVALDELAGAAEGLRQALA